MVIRVHQSDNDSDDENGKELDLQSAYHQLVDEHARINKRNIKLSIKQSVVLVSKDTWK